MRRKALNRYSNNKLLKYLSEIKSNDTNIVLFGEVGSGKTTLLNRICGQNYQNSDEVTLVLEKFNLVFHRFMI